MSGNDLRGQHDHGNECKDQAQDAKKHQTAHRDADSCHGMTSLIMLPDSIKPTNPKNEVSSPIKGLAGKQTRLVSGSGAIPTHHEINVNMPGSRLMIECRLSVWIGGGSSFASNIIFARARVEPLHSE